MSIAIKNDEVQAARARLRRLMRGTRWLRRAALLLAAVIVVLVLAIRLQA